MLKKILTLKEYQHFFYIKKIELKNGYLLIKKENIDMQLVI